MMLSESTASHISGKSVVGRHEFQRMLRDAQDHRFDCVIVWKIDRFGRDRQDIAVSKMKLKKAGVSEETRNKVMGDTVAEWTGLK